MALITGAFTRRETVIPEALRAKLGAMAALEGVDERILRIILAEAAWFSLPGGTELIREGENDRAVFLIVSGALGVFAGGERGEPQLIAHVPAGETVGEMAFVTGEPHSARLVALRDTELLRLDYGVMERMVERFPRLTLNLMKLVARRLRIQSDRSARADGPRTIALAPLQSGIDLAQFSRALVSAFAAEGLRAGRIDAQASEQKTDWFTRFEAGHDIVVYEGDEPESAWTQLCLRQADRVLLVASADRPAPFHPGLEAKRGSTLRAAAELVILREGPGAELRLDAAASRLSVSLRHVVRRAVATDVPRLARILTGRAVSLVLAGGGARGFAHLGVVRALREAGVPFDMIGGVSMGAIVAAAVAMEWSDQEIADRMRASFVEQDPLDDWTLPLAAVLRGRKVERLLRENFGETQIEDMARPFFCVSADITRGDTRVHEAGPLWRALKASVAIPGLLPPVVFGGHLCVDGGIMNNLPIDVMARRTRGPVIGVDVTGDARMYARDLEVYERNPWKRLFSGSALGAPSITSILMRVGTVGNEVQRRIARRQAALMFEPPLDGVGLRDWKKFRSAVEDGYEHARRVIDAGGLAYGLTAPVPVPESDDFAAEPGIPADAARA